MTREESSACVVDALGGALANSDDLLRRLSEWDVLNLPPGSGDDGPFWLGEIDNARTLNRIALQQAKQADCGADTASAQPERLVRGCTTCEDLLARAAAGEDADLLLIEFYANTDRDEVTE